MSKSGPTTILRPDQVDHVLINGTTGMPIRIYSLAKELDYDSIAIVGVVRLCGITGKQSALASLADDEACQVRAFVSENAEAVSRIEAEHRRKLQEEQENSSKAATASRHDVTSGTSSGAFRKGGGNESIARDSNENVLVNAVSSDMFKGFEHFAVIELGALFEMFLSQIDCDLDTDGLGRAIRKNCGNGVVSPALTQPLIAANRTRNRIVHRRPKRFPTSQEISNAKRSFAVAIIDMHKRHHHLNELLVSLVDSNPEVLNVLDGFFVLDE